MCRSIWHADSYRKFKQRIKNNNMKKFFLSLIAVAAFTLSANAELKNANSDLLSKVKTANESVKTISCTFTQTKKMAFIEKATKKEGDFNYTKPSMLSMKYTDTEAVIINDNNVTLGMNGKVRNVKAKNKHVEALAATLLSCMSGDVAELDGTLTSAEQKSDYILFKIDVDFSVGKGAISKLELKYEKSDMTLKSLNMIEDDGSYTLYELQSKKLNTTIDESVYTLKK